ncbi:MAG TPA: WD40 repeat domain-containing protein, partial [Candidatus Babeliaceae bacterium]|nr:WD40 repeat domain-containing protein [Candidatus Babeliaceae bacterium]
MNKFFIRLSLSFIILVGQIQAAEVPSLKNLCLRAGAKVSDEVLLQNLDRIPNDCLMPILIQKISFLERLISFSEPLKGVEKIYAVAMTADGSKGLSGGAWDHDVTVWDLRKKKVIGRLEGHTWDVQCLAITPDGSRGLSGSNDQTVKIWDLDTMENIGSLTVGRSVDSVAITSDGKKGLSASGNGIKLWDLDTMQEISLDTLLPENTKSAKAVAINQDGTRAVSVSYDGFLRVWDFAAMKVVSIETQRGLRSVAINAEGTIGLSGSGADDKSIKLWDLVSMTEIATLAHLPWGYVHSVAMTPDGTLGISGESNAIKILDLGARKEIASLGINAHSRDVSSVAISANGLIGLSGSWDGTLRLWDLRPLLIKYLPLDFLKKIYVWLYKDKKAVDEVYKLIINKFREIEEMQKLPIPIRELVEKRIKQQTAKELKGKAITRRKLMPEKPTGLFELPGVKKPEPVSKRRPPYKQPGLYEIL